MLPDNCTISLNQKPKSKGKIFIHFEVQKLLFNNPWVIGGITKQIWMYSELIDTENVNTSEIAQKKSIALIAYARKKSLKSMT